MAWYIMVDFRNKAINRVAPMDKKVSLRNGFQFFASEGERKQWTSAFFEVISSETRKIFCTIKDPRCDECVVEFIIFTGKIRYITISSLAIRFSVTSLIR
jgi:hypothetical protein